MNGYKIVLLKAIFMLYRLPECERVCSGICKDFIDEDDDFNDDLVFVTGLMDGKPAIQNLGTKEIILVELNSKDGMIIVKKASFKAGFLLSGIIREILVQHFIYPYF